MNKRIITLVLIFICFHVSAQKGVFAPTLTSPKDSSIHQSAELMLFWSPVSDAYIYKVQVDTVIPNTNLHSISVINATSLDLQKLIFGKTYYWRVKSFSENLYTGKVSDSSAWSSVSTFSVIDSVILLKPRNNSVSQTLPVSLTWTAVQGVTAYDYEVDITPQFNTSSVYYQKGSNLSPKPGVLPAAKVTISKLLYGTTYYWRIRTKHSKAISNWSETRNFTTIINITDIPVIVIPADSSSNVTPKYTFKWNPMQNSIGFYFQLAKDTSFKAAYSDSVMLNKHGVRIDTFLIVDTMSWGQRYYWRVKGIDTNRISSWSKVNTFTVISLPTLTSPVNFSINQLTTNLSFTWQAINGASTYQFQLDTLETTSFLHPVITNSIKTAATTVSGLKNSKDYYWRVRAWDKKDTSDWSVTYHLTTYDGHWPAPILTTPPNASVNQLASPRFVWQGVSTTMTVSYKILASTKPDDFSSPLFVRSTAVTALYSPIPLPNGEVIYWKVKAFANKDSSAYSSVFSFTTVNSFPQAPALYTPSDGAINQMPDVNLSWSQTSGTTTYIVEVGLDSNFDIPEFIDTVSTLNLNPPNLKFGKTYYWRIRTLQTGNTSPWSSVYSFTLINVPLQYKPIDKATNQSITGLALQWNKFTGITCYEVQVDTSSAFSSTFLMYAKVNDSINVYNHLYYSTHYFWRVRAISTSDTTLWSDISSFTTARKVKILSPINNLKNTGTEITINFTHLTGATDYDYKLDVKKSFTTPKNITSTYGLTKYKISNLQLATTYYLLVRGRNSYDTSEWSDTISFSTISKTKLISPANNSQNQMLLLNLYWENVLGSSQYNYKYSTSPFFNLSNTISVNTLDNFVSTDTLKFGKLYYWEVQVFSGLNYIYSDTLTFKTIDSLTVIKPANKFISHTTAGAQKMNVVFKWESIKGVKNYQLQLSQNDTLHFATTTISSSLDSIKINNIAVGQYYWRMRATTGSDSTVWSKARLFTLVLGVQNINADNMSVDVYPVPCKDKLFISFDNKEHATYMNVSLINLLGQSIYREKMSINQGLVIKSIDVNELDNGIYYLKLENGSFINTRKLIIQK